MGKAPTRTVRSVSRTSPNRLRTPTEPREVTAPARWRAKNKKFWAPPAR